MQVGPSIVRAGPRPLSSAHHGGFDRFGGADPGLARLFTGEFGFEVGWLLPAALLALVVVIVARARAPRTDLIRGGAVLFGGWLLVDGLVLSYMKGMVHPYYCLSVAPAMVGLVAIGGSEMWRLRRTVFGRISLAAMVLTTGPWSWWLLGRNADWMPPLRWVILAVTVVATIALLVALSWPTVADWPRQPRPSSLSPAPARLLTHSPRSASRTTAGCEVGPQSQPGTAPGRAAGPTIRTMSSSTALLEGRPTQMVGSGERVVGGGGSRVVDRHRGDGDRRVRGQ